MTSVSDFFAECDKAPRLNELAGFFAATAAGKSGMPLVTPRVDRRLLPADSQLARLIELHASRQGYFDRHYHSSIPYRLEEECRMAYALLKYARHQASPLTFYSLGTAEGTMARTLSEMAEGRVLSLCCSPNSENYQCFRAFGDPPHAEFFLGPFHRFTKERLDSEPQYKSFVAGFDVIFEDTTFQMYSPNRSAQIEFVSQHLKTDGIFLVLEKFRADPLEYERREQQKDFGFKSRYFSSEEIERKKGAVLTTMFESEVTLADMRLAISAHFAHCRIVWNSGNFYCLAASNSREKLLLYLSEMAPPAIPLEYVYEDGLKPDGSSWTAPNLDLELL